MSRLSAFLCLLGLQACTVAGDRKPDPPPPPPDPPLSKEAVARFGTAPFWHADKVEALAISPDGRFLATAEGVSAREPQAEGGWSSGPHGTSLRIWDARSGQQLHAIPLSVHSLAFSPDGRTLAVGAFGDAWLFEVSAKGKLGKRTEMGDKGDRVRFTDGGKTLICSDGFGIESLDIGTGKTLATWKYPERSVSLGEGKIEEPQSLELSPDGRFLACRMLMRVPSKDNPREFSSGGERGCVYDVATKKRLFSSRHYRYSIQFAFSADSKLVAVGGDPVVVLDSRTGKQLHEMPTAGESLPSLFFSPDSKTLAIVQLEMGRVACWDLKANRKLSSFVIGKIDRFHSDHLPIAFAPDGKTLWTANDRLVRRWDPATGKEIGDHPGHRRPVTSLTFSVDGKVLTSASDEAVLRWDTRSARQLERLDYSHRVEGKMLSVSFPLLRGVWENPDGKYTFHDLKSGKALARIEEKSEQLLLGNPFVFPGKTLLSFDFSDKEGTTYRRYDGETGKKLDSVLYEGIDSGGDTNPTASPDGKALACCSRDGSIVLLDAETGKVRQRFTQKVILPAERGNAELYRIVFSPDGKYLASVFNKEFGEQHNAIQVWEIASGLEVGRVVVPPKMKQRFAVAGLALSPDNRWLAFGMYGDNSVRVWEIASESEKVLLEGHRGVVSSVTFSPDGSLLASGSEDTTIVTWDMKFPHSTAPVRPRRLDEKELSRCWEDLAGRDPRKAEEVIRALIGAAEQAVPFLSERIKSVQIPEPDSVRELVKRLDSNRPRMRQEAREALELLGEPARPGLQTALKGELSLEAKRQVEELIENRERTALSSQRIRQLRALEVLERVDNQEARKLLQELSRGATAARLTREAQATLQRVEGRSKKP